MDVKTQKMFTDIIVNANKRTVSPYPTTAKVNSVNGNTIYVEIPGSDRITPVKSSSVSVKKGDIVDLVVSHDDTHITGNRSDVAVSQTTVEQISQAFEAGQLNANNALNLFDNKIIMIGNDVNVQNNKINTLDDSVKIISSTIETINSDLSSIESTIELYGSEIETINSTIETINSTIETLDSTVKTQGSKIETIDSSIQIINSDLFLNTEGGNVSVNNNCSRAIMLQDGAIYAKNSSYNNGSYLCIIDSLNENGNTTLGYGGYLNNIGETDIYGEKINLRSNTEIKMEDTNGNECLRVYGTDQVSIGNHGYSNNQGATFLSGYDVWVQSSNYVYSDRRLRVLWSGSYYMKEDQSITLADSISNQLTGVILAWSAYDNGAAGDYDWNYIFVPKEHALTYSGSGVVMTLISSTGWTMGAKYVYVSDTSISGHSNNNKESTEENGWIVNPSRFVLRYVYGV